MLPEFLKPDDSDHEFGHIRTSQEFVADVQSGIEAAPMSIRLTPHILSIIDWENPFKDPIRKQFIPMKSSLRPDHPKLELDSLHETRTSPVPGLVHRYPDKALFLGTSLFRLIMANLSCPNSTFDYSNLRLSCLLSLLVSLSLIHFWPKLRVSYAFK